jgi:hypothetical protein
MISAAEFLALPIMETPPLLALIGYPASAQAPRNAIVNEIKD